MTSHYTRGSVTTLRDFGGVLGQPWDAFFWALTTSWSRLLARVWSGPQARPSWHSGRKPRTSLLLTRILTHTYSTSPHGIHRNENRSSAHMSLSYKPRLNINSTACLSTGNQGRGLPLSVLRLSYSYSSNFPKILCDLLFMLFSPQGFTQLYYHVLGPFSDLFYLYVM